VIFRAESLDSAWLILRGMVGANGVVIPTTLAPLLGSFAFGLEPVGISIGELPMFLGPRQALWIAGLMAIALVAPNSQQLMSYIAPNDVEMQRPALRPKVWPRWSLSRGWALVAATTFIYTLTQMSKISEFLYYQF
jgi:alginate O-acetyltransferase complex protein AlgI